MLAEAQYAPVFRGVIPPAAAAGFLWPQIGPLIARAIPYGRGEYTLGDVREGIENGAMLAVGSLCDGEVGFVLTCTVAVYPRKRVLYVQYGAGRDGRQMKEVLIEVARALNCDWIETRCREAVATLYRRAGFETGYQVCILEIDDAL